MGVFSCPQLAILFVWVTIAAITILWITIKENMSIAYCDIKGFFLNS